jgi:hypothetical protein
VDGEYIPDTPTVLFDEGRFHKEVKQVITANMANEGMGLASDENMPESFGRIVRPFFPTADNKTIDHIQSLFPYPPELPQKLAWDWFTAIIYACHSHSIAKSYGDKARRYVMDIPPAVHGQDMYCKLYRRANARITASPNTL